MDEKFSREYRFLSVTKGLILVKRSIFGGIKVKGRIVEPKVVEDKHPEYEEVEVIKDEDVLLSRMSDEMLEQLYQRVNDAQKILIDNVKKARAGSIPETPEIKNATIKIRRKEIERRPKNKRPNIKIRKIEAKLGIKIRWPWQSVLILSTTEQPIDTPSIDVIANDNTTKIQIDTDYRYRIIDAEQYATELNGLSEQPGVTSPSQALRNNISQLLDDLVTNYVKTHKVEDLMGKPSFNLLDDLNYEVGAIEKQYGIEVTKFLIKGVHLPQELLDANMKKKTASANAEAAKAEKNVENEVLKNLITLLKEQGLSSEQIAQYLTTKGAKNATVFNIPNSLRDSIFNGQRPDVQQSSTPAPETPEPVVEPQSTQNNNSNTQYVDAFSALGFCDEDGCLSRDDSKAIMANRGMQLEPGRVLMIYDLTKEEIRILQGIVASRNTQSSNQHHM